MRLSPPLNLPAPGRCQAIFVILTISHSHVFLVNSRLGHFSAPPSRGVPFSRSYGVNLPSSLAMIHSSTLGFSPHPPVSVYGTGRGALSGSRVFSLVCLPALSARPKARRTVGFHSRYALQPPIPYGGGSVTPRSPVAPRRGRRNIDRLSIACPSRVPLSPRLTLIRLTLFRKPWVFGAGISIPVVVTYAYIFFSGRSSGPPGPPSALAAMLPYRADRSAPIASAAVLMPAHHPRVTARLVSCYALFE